jgi:hypothetical protein
VYHLNRDSRSENPDTHVTVYQSETMTSETETPTPVTLNPDIHVTRIQRTTNNSKPKAVAGAPGDGRHTQIREFIKAQFTEKAGFPIAPWDGRDAKALDRLLKANPNWPVDEFIRLIANRFESEVSPGDPAWEWLPKLQRYTVRLDRFNKPILDNSGFTEAMIGTDRGGKWTDAFDDYRPSRAQIRQHENDQKFNRVAADLHPELATMCPGCDQPVVEGVTENYPYCSALCRKRKTPASQSQLIIGEVRQ